MGVVSALRFSVDWMDLRGPTVKDADVDKLASARPALRIVTWNRVIEPKVEELGLESGGGVRWELLTTLVIGAAARRRQAGGEGEQQGYALESGHCPL